MFILRIAFGMGIINDIRLTILIYISIIRVIMWRVWNTPSVDATEVRALRNVSSSKVKKWSATRKLIPEII